MWFVEQKRKISQNFCFKDLDKQKDLSVIELHTQLNQIYNELKIKKKNLLYSQNLIVYEKYYIS